MRHLFLSEVRYIRNVLLKWGVSTPDISPILVDREYYALPHAHSSVRFNNDFVLQFAPIEDFNSPKTFVAPILPTTLGCDVFVTIDERTGSLLRTELLGGEAFATKYYKSYFDVVEQHLARLSCSVRLRRTAYCRMFVIQGDICFLAFPHDTVPTTRGTADVVSATDGATIACSRDGDDIVRVDGWVRTVMPKGEWKLEAIPILNETGKDADRSV